MKGSKVLESPIAPRYTHSNLAPGPLTPHPGQVLHGRIMLSAACSTQSSPCFQQHCSTGGAQVQHAEHGWQHTQQPPPLTGVEHWVLRQRNGARLGQDARHGHPLRGAHRGTRGTVARGWSHVSARLRGDERIRQGSAGHGCSPTAGQAWRPTSAASSCWIALPNPYPNPHPNPYCNLTLSPPPWRASSLHAPAHHSLMPAAARAGPSLAMPLPLPPSGAPTLGLSFWYSASSLSV